MPTTVTEDGSSYPTLVQVPSPGEPRTAASILLPVQTLANRCANLFARLNTFISVGDNGIRKIRITASFSALLALTDHNDGDIIIVNGNGLYQYVASSTFAVTPTSVIKPNDITTAGRWILLGTAAGNMASAPATLDSNALLPKALLPALPMQFLDITTVNASGAFNTTFQTLAAGSGWSDASGMNVSLVGCHVGDVLDVTSILNYSTVSSGGAEMQMVVNDGGSDTVIPETHFHVSLTSEAGAPMNAVHVVGTAGTVSMRLQANPLTSALALIVPSTLTVRRYRP